MDGRCSPGRSRKGTKAKKGGAGAGWPLTVGGGGGRAGGRSLANPTRQPPTDKRQRVRGTSMPTLTFSTSQRCSGGPASRAAKRGPPRHRPRGSSPTRLLRHKAMPRRHAVLTQALRAARSGGSQSPRHGQGNHPGRRHDRRAAAARPVNSASTTTRCQRNHRLGRKRQRRDERTRRTERASTSVGNFNNQDGARSHAPSRRRGVVAARWAEHAARSPRSAGLMRPRPRLQEHRPVHIEFSQIEGIARRSASC